MENLENVKEGDVLFSYGRFSEKLLTVTKITKTQITLSDGSRYKRDTGRMIGSDAWSGRWVRLPLEEDYARLRLAKIKTKLSNRLLDLRNRVENMDFETASALLEKIS